MSDIKSPFPGMDPYLEQPHRWQGIHTDLIVRFRNLIGDNLPDNFSVKIEGNVTLVTPDEDDMPWVKPDVYITKSSPIRGAQREYAAIAEAIPIKMVPIPMFEMKERWLEIIDRDNQQVITTIEVVSPRNKKEGFHKFNKKRDKVVKAGGNWVEVDLLRAGRRPHPQLNTAAYCALTIRAGQDEGEAWLMNLRESLVTIGVPLTDGYDDVPLPLQIAVENVYRDGRYWRDLPYHQVPPFPELSDEDGAWVVERLEAWQKMV